MVTITHSRGGASPSQSPPWMVARKLGPVNDLRPPRGVRRGQSSDRDGELVTERLDEWLRFVLGRINIYDWKHRLAHVPKEYERLGKQLFV